MTEKENRPTQLVILLEKVLPFFFYIKILSNINLNRASLCHHDELIFFLKKNKWVNVPSRSKQDAFFVFRSMTEGIYIFLYKKKAYDFSALVFPLIGSS